MSIDNITITSDSEIGYHIYMYYTDFRVGCEHKECICYWSSADNIENVIANLLVKIVKLNKEEENE